jgi:hypothetical protein
MPGSAATAPALPAVTFERRPPAAAPSPLRTDVAGVLARTARGPVGDPVRVEGWAHFQAVFGDMDGVALSPYCVRGYFENGGEVAWVTRLARDAVAAAAVLDVSRAQGLLGSTPPRPAPQRLATELRCLASSPGEWGNALEVRLRLRVRGAPGGVPTADLLVRNAGVQVEHLTDLPADRVVEEVNARSAWVQLEVTATTPLRGAPPERVLDWPAVGVLRLQGGRADAAGAPEYLEGAAALCALPEPALLLAPDARPDLGDGADDLLAGWADLAAAALDRLVIVDPPERADAAALRDLAAGFGAALEAPGLYRAAAAVYYPWVLVPDPAGSPLQPTRSVPPSGHVAGLVSRLDRERGAHHTPANAALVGAVDVDAPASPEAQAALYGLGLDPLRCMRAAGVVVWGGRTLDRDPSRRFVAHRRLLHRLVRAIRAAAQPLVFETNGPTLRLALVRAITSVLLAAFRAGALKGVKPSEGFQVSCDEQTNPPDALDTGVCIAEVAVAPAVPMEFIRLTVAVSQDGSLQVLE